MSYFLENVSKRPFLEGAVFVVKIINISTTGRTKGWKFHRGTYKFSTKVSGIRKCELSMKLLLVHKELPTLFHSIISTENCMFFTEPEINLFTKHDILWYPRN